MILDVSVTGYRQMITSYEIGLARDALSAATLRRNYVPAWFANRQSSNWAPDLNGPPGFQRYVDKYAEVVLKDPWDDVTRYYAQYSMLMGAPTPLAFPPRYPQLNSAAMANAAEALAGWYCEVSDPSWAFLGRPQRVSPDFIFYERTTGRFALVEVKSSGRASNVMPKITSDMIKLLRTLASTKQISTGKYLAGIILIQLQGPTSAALTSLVLDEA